MARHLKFVVCSMLSFACLGATAAYADDTTSSSPAPANPQQLMQWQKDQQLDRQVHEDLNSGGLSSVGRHVADIESALTNAAASMAQANAGPAKFTFSDGAAQSFLAVITASLDKSGTAKQVLSVPNVYPDLSLYLGSYYNEIGKSDDALRVLDEGLVLDGVSATATTTAPASPFPTPPGDHAPFLISEKGAALLALKRMDDALADYNAGLALKVMPDPARARLLRGRGYILTEQNKLDDAEAAYQESLKLEPGNQRAQTELQYIARLKSGGSAAPGGMISVVHPPGQQPQTIITQSSPASTGVSSSTQSSDQTQTAPPPADTTTPQPAAAH